MCSDVIVCPGNSHSTSVCRAFGKMGHSAWGGGVDPPRAGVGLATGVHIPPPGLRDGAACGEQEKEREGCFGWGGWCAEVTDSHPRGRGPREPCLLSGSSHPQFPSLSPAGSRKHAVALVQPGSPPPPPPGTHSRMESGSRGEVEVSSPGFISCGRHNTLHKPGGLKQEKLTLSHFWRPEVQNQGCPRSLKSLWWGNLCLASSSSWCCWLLGLWPCHSFPVSVFT